MRAAREQVIARALADLSDTLLSDFDVIDFLHSLASRCVDLTGVQAAGVVLSGPLGLRVMGSSSERPLLLELFAWGAREGPCADSFLSGAPVSEPDLEPGGPRRQDFATRARSAGFRSVHAVPVRLRDRTIGVLTLLATGAGALPARGASTARALADIIALAVVTDHAADCRQALAHQLQRSVVSRAAVERATSLFAELLDLDRADAFTELRGHARRTGRGLSEVAADIATGDPPSTPPQPEPGRSRVLLLRRIGNGETREIQAQVQTAGARHGLTRSQQAAFTLALHEAAVNTLEHGGGTGRVIVWRYADSLYAEVSDRGSGLPAGYRVPTGPPPTGTDDRRGLWLINRICTTLDVESGPAGARLLLRYAINTPSPDPPHQ